MPVKPPGGEAKSGGTPKDEFFYDGQRWSWRSPEVFNIADDTDGDQNRADECTASAVYGSHQVDGYGARLLKPSMAAVILVVLVALLIPEKWIGHGANNMDFVRETAAGETRAHVPGNATADAEPGDAVTETAATSVQTAGDVADKPSPASPTGGTGDVVPEPAPPNAPAESIGESAPTTAMATVPAAGGAPQARTEIVRWKGLKPECLAESFVVGAKIVKLRNTADLESQEIARLSPGTRVRLLRPCQNQQGLVRVLLCAVAEDTVAQATRQDTASPTRSSKPSASGRLQFVPRQTLSPRCLDGLRGWATLTAEFIQGPRYFELVQR